ncbi:hypothetical protein SDC9_174375 [bioreactor metagenome]|uniref:Uncharacterized protein n=1 Tax=bioreactor metagenome TaxID=1076179 RepID=A0A645GM50_9ZZZZ
MRHILYGVVIDTLFRYFDATHPFTHSEERFTIRVGRTHSVNYDLIVVEPHHFGSFRHERPPTIGFFGHLTTETDFHFSGVWSMDTKVHTVVGTDTRILRSGNIVFIGYTAFRERLLRCSNHRKAY